MISTVILGILLLIILVAIGVFVVGSGNSKFGAAATAGAAMIVFLIVAAFSCTYIVGTRQVGIVTKWNKPTGETFDSGLHIVLPWTDVHEMDAAIQNDVYNGLSRIQVRLGNNSTALADANIRWEINQADADDIFQQYKTFDNVRSNLVTRNLQTALNEAFTKFNPLEDDVDNTNNLSAVTANALKLMREKSGSQVRILDLSIPVIDYDEQTEQKINNINGANADLTKATIDKKTAEQKRLAAEELSKQAPPNLNVAIAACLNRMAESGTNLNCFPIGNGVVPTLAIPNPAG